jgi:hypothetical protein
MIKSGLIAVWSGLPDMICWSQGDRTVTGDSPADVWVSQRCIWMICVWGALQSGLSNSVLRPVWLNLGFLGPLCHPAALVPVQSALADAQAERGYF